MHTYTDQTLTIGVTYQGVTFNNCKIYATNTAKFLNCQFNDCVIDASGPHTTAVQCMFKDTTFLGDTSGHFLNCNFHRCLYGSIQNASHIRCTHMRTQFAGDIAACDFSNSSFNIASFNSVVLRTTNFYRSRINGVNLASSQFKYCCFDRADFINCSTRDASVYPFQIPQIGPLAGYKKVQWSKGYAVIKVIIPGDALRTASVVGRKCRADYAIPEIPDGTVYRSLHDRATEYKHNIPVLAHKYDNDPFVECAPGIHFFLTEEEAHNFHG